MTKKWLDWMMNGAEQLSARGVVEVAPFEEIYRQIVEGFNPIGPQIMLCSLMRCGISNVLDGTEVDILWQERRKMTRK